MNSNSALCGPVCGFGRQARETDTTEAPDRPCWSRVGQLWANPGAVVKPRRVKNSIASTWRENVERSKRKRRKKKAGPVGPAMARLQRTGYPRWRKKFSSAHRTGLDRIVGSGHNPNVEQKKEGVKKEQEKG